MRTCSFVLFLILISQFSTAQNFISKEDDLSAIDNELYYETLSEEVKNSAITIDEEDLKALDAKELKMKAIKDAQNNYQGKNSGAVWTGVATAITSPVLGLIPAGITSHAAPSNKNLRMNDEELQNNYDYYMAYREEAHKIKKRRNWTAYGIGSAVWLVLAILIY